MNNPEQYDAVVAINVDMQNDFCPGGAIPVPDGDAVVPIMNQVNDWVRSRSPAGNLYSTHDKLKSAVIFTADWHPEDDVNGGLWPVHCLQHKAGAAFHDDLKIEEYDTIAYKGMSKKDDGYSGWEAEIDTGPLFRRSFGLNEVMVDNVKWALASLSRIYNARGNFSEQPRKVAVIIGGLATEYCVKATVLDALKEEAGFLDFPQLAKQLGIYVIEDAIRAVDLKPGDGAKAIQEMKAAGAKFVNSADVIAGKVIGIRRD